jgi:hypothetical protein
VPPAVSRAPAIISITPAQGAEHVRPDTVLTVAGTNRKLTGLRAQDGAGHDLAGPANVQKNAALQIAEVNRPKGQVDPQVSGPVDEPVRRSEPGCGAGGVRGAGQG